MDLSIENTGTDAALTVTGDLDVDNAYDVYAAAAAQAEGGATTVTIDLAGVSFIDSVGLGQLIRTRDDLTHLYESKLVLRNPSQYVARLLELTALQSQFNITS